MQMFKQVILAISACTTLAGCASPVKDACKLLGRERVEEAMKAKLVRSELDPSVSNRKVSSSACMMNFDDGVFVRLSVTEYHDTEYRNKIRDMTGKDNRFPVDEQGTKDLGFPVFYDKGREALEADVSSNREVFINLDQYGRPVKASASKEGSMAVMRFERDNVPQAREKAVALARLTIPN